MALTKVTGEFIDIGDIDISDVGTISLDAIQGDADANTSITFSGSDVITIATGGSGRLTIGDGALSPVTNNQIDLGTASLEFKNAFFDGTVTADAFAGPLTGDVTGNVSGTAATVTTAAQSAITSVGTLTSFRSTGIDDNADALAITITSGENVYIGQTASSGVRGIDNKVQASGTDLASSSLALHRYQANAFGPYLHFAKSRHASIGSHTIVQDGDVVGALGFYPSDGGDFVGHCAEIVVQVDGTPGSDDLPGRILFKTTADGATSSTERMRITSTGAVGIGTTSPDCTLHINGSANSEQVIITGNNNAGRGLSISTAANGGQQDAHVIFNAQDTGHADYPMITFQTGGTERMRIQPAGHVNIGIGGSGGDLIMQPLAKLYLDAGGNTYIQESAGDVIDVYTGGARRLRVNSNGLIFNTDTAAANALDDYEEGTFTPSYTVAGGGSVTGVSSTNVGTYTKIGNMVHVTVRSHFVQTTGTVPTAYNMTLPFQAKNTGGMGGSGIGQEIAQTGKNMFISIDGNATTCNIKAPTNTAPPANAYMDLSFTYQAG